MIDDITYYIKEISKRSSKYGSQLIDMMNFYNVNSLSELTLKQVEEFYFEMIKKDIDDTKEEKNYV